MPAGPAADSCRFWPRQFLNPPEQAVHHTASGDSCSKANDSKAKELKATVSKKTDSMETDPQEIDPAEIDPAEPDPAETDPAETDPKEADSRKACSKANLFRRVFRSGSQADLPPGQALRRHNVATCASGASCTFASLGIALHFSFTSPFPQAERRLHFP